MGSYYSRYFFIDYMLLNIGISVPAADCDYEAVYVLVCYLFFSLHFILNTSLLALFYIFIIMFDNL